MHEISDPKQVSITTDPVWAQIYYLGKVVASIEGHMIRNKAGNGGQAYRKTVEMTTAQVYREISDVALIHKGH
jgi:hypothetical protein